MSGPSRDPPRWADSQGEWRDVADGLAASANVERSAEQRAQLWTAIEAQVARGAPIERPAQGPLERGLALKAGVLSLTLAGLGALYVRVGPGAHTEAAVKPAPPPPAAPASGTAPVIEPAPLPQVVLAPVAPPGPEPAPARKLRAQARQPHAAVPPARPDAVAAKGTAAAELTLLTRARRVLLADPERSLALAEEHARSYPSGVFAEEREVLAVEALQRAGRAREASERARRFVRDHPKSPHVLRMQELSAIELQREPARFGGEEVEP